MTKTTFDKWMENENIKKQFKKERKELFLSELIIALMEDDHKSVRALSKETDLSPSVIQNLRSRHQQDVKMKNFVKIVSACGYHLILEKGNNRITLDNIL